MITGVTPEQPGCVLKCAESPTFDNGLNVEPESHIQLADPD
jgi:hypothetical protein